LLAPVAGHIALVVIICISILLMLIRPRNISEVYWVGGGVLLLVVFRLVPLRAAERAAWKGMDVYLFLIGMMLLSELAREYGVFDWVSSAALRSCNGSRSRLFFLVYAAGTIVTILMSNDATAVVLTPAILVAVRKTRIEPLPYLFACAFIANAASFVLPISNPANLVVFDAHMPRLTEWLSRFLVPSILSIASTFAILRWMFRRELKGTISIRAEDCVLTHQGKLVVGGLAVTIGGLLAASALGWDLGLPTCLIALAVTAVVSILARKSPAPLLRGISWATLALVAGLFIMVDATESIGAMKYTEAWLHQAQTLGSTSGVFATGICVGIANNLINNLPLGLIAGSTLRTVQAAPRIFSATLIGVDLGPNLAVTGSLATILWLIALRKEKIDVSFWRFLKVGAIAMPVPLLLSLAGAIAIQWCLQNW